MAGSLGSLVIELSANVARLQSDLGKAAHLAERTASQIEGALGTIGIGLSVAGITAFVKDLNDAAAGVRDLATRTGSTVERMAQLSRQAYISGASIEAVESALNKMTQGLNESDDGAVKTQRALRALGLDVDALKRLDPADAFRTVAVELNKFADSGGKTALMLDLMGKGAAQVAPFLKDLANDEQALSRLTTEQAATAETAGKQFRLLLNESRELKQQFVLELVPSFTEFIKSVRISIQEVGLFETALINVGNAMAFITRQTDTQKVGRQVEALDEQIAVALKQLESGSLAPKGVGGFWSFLIPDVKLTDEAKRRLQTTVDALIAQRDKLLAPTSAGAPTRVQPPVRPKVELDYEPFDPAKAKAAEDARQKLLDEGAKQELELFKQLGTDRTAVLDALHTDNLIGEKQYWMLKLDIVRQSLDAELKVLDEQKKRQEDVLKKQKEGTKEFFDAQAGLQDTQAKRNKLEQAFGQLAVMSNLQAGSATKALERDIENVNIEIEDLLGNTAKAAAARFELANRDRIQKFGANDRPEAVAALKTLGDLTAAQATLKEAKEKQDAITTRLSLSEDRIQNSLRTGAINELDALKKTGEARKDAIAQLQNIVANQERIAELSGSDAMVLQAQQARGALEKLRSETDLVGEKYATIFKDNFANAFADFATGAKSAKDAFTDFAKGVVSELVRIQAQAAATNIWNLITGKGSSGSAGGGGFLSGIFSLFGGGGGGSTAGMAAAAGNSGSLEGALLGSFAVGTDYVPRTGIALIHQGEKITPASENHPGSGAVNIYVEATDAASFMSRLMQPQMRRAIRSAVGEGYAKRNRGTPFRV